VTTTSDAELEASLGRFYAYEVDAAVVSRLDERLGRVLGTRTSPGRLLSEHRIAAWSGALLAAVVVMAGAAVVFGTFVRSQPQPTVVVRQMDSYPLDDSPDAAATFPGNKVILRGHIAAFLPAQWSSADHETGHIYTPVRILVDEVVRGSIPGTEVVVQSLGGSVDDVTMEFSDAPTLTELPMGSEVLLFLSATDTGSGLPPTPNMAYTIDGNVATSMYKPDEQTQLDSLLALIRAASPNP
jgi:hypothetical protein